MNWLSVTAFFRWLMENRLKLPLSRTISEPNDCSQVNPPYITVFLRPRLYLPFSRTLGIRLHRFFHTEKQKVRNCLAVQNYKKVKSSTSINNLTRILHGIWYFPYRNENLIIISSLIPYLKAYTSEVFLIITGQEKLSETILTNAGDAGAHCLTWLVLQRSYKWKYKTIENKSWSR